MTGYSAPAAAKNGPRRPALLAIARIAFWFGFAVLAICSIVLFTVHTVLSGNSSLPSFGAEEAMLIALLAILAVPLLARLRGQPRFEAILTRVAAHRRNVWRPVQAHHPGRS